MSLLFRYPIKNLSWRKACENLESAKQILPNKNPIGIYQLSRNDISRWLDNIGIIFLRYSNDEIYRGIVKIDLYFDQIRKGYLPVPRTVFSPCIQQFILHFMWEYYIDFYYSNLIF